MNDVRALVVGVSRYSVAGWTQEGPARNAGLIAATLLDLGLPATRLHLLATPEDMLPQHRDALAAAGVAAGGTDFTSIDDLWRGPLRELAAPGERLLVFWSGHGVTDDRDHRVFMCSDYDRGRSNRVFDAVAFMRHLTTEPWNRYGDQLILADACGNYPTFPVDPPRGGPEGRRSGTRQLAIWAVPDGEYAIEEAGLGAFTRTIADVLRGTGLSPWPSQQRFATEVESRTAGWSNEPTWLRIDGTHAKFAGYAGKASVVPDLIALLGSMRLAQVAPAAYERTAQLLGIEPIRLDSVPEMLEVLADLDDGWDTDVPLGLAVFLLRLVNDGGTRRSEADRIRRWLEDNALAGVRDEAGSKISAERQTALLLVDVETGPAGEFRSITAHLRYPDLSPIPGFGERTEEAADWAAVCARVNRLLAMAAEFGNGETEVHLLLDPSAFGMPFHQIPLTSGMTLGEEHVCVVHCRRRARTSGGNMLDQWKTWARAVPNPVDLEQLHALPAPGGAVARAGGIYYSSDRIGATPQRWLHVGKLLRLGAPYFCWPVEGEADPPPLPDALRTMIGKTQSTAGVPNLLRTERLRGCPNAREIAILWDDAAFRPFKYQQLEGMS